MLQETVNMPTATGFTFESVITFHFVFMARKLLSCLISKLLNKWYSVGNEDESLKSKLFKYYKNSRLKGSCICYWSHALIYQYEFKAIKFNNRKTKL